jgi:hypothetical protein
MKNQNIRITKEMKEISEKWQRNHGAASFDFKKRNIILHDGGLFAVNVETKTKPKKRIWFDKKHPVILNDHKGYNMITAPIKKNGKFVLEKVDYYSVAMWFEEIDDTIRYFKSMKRMLNKLGFNTNRFLKKEASS